MAIQSTITLNNGTVIPQIGLGVFRTPDGDTTVNAVQAALENGYRHIDTAMIYRNETSVGEGIRRSGVPRGDLYVTTKLWNDVHRKADARRAIETSLEKLGLDHVDLYLIHWPAPKRDQYVATWKAFIQLQKEGRARSIGVSNFYPEHLQRLIDETGITPVINQIELHPDFPQKEARAYHDKHRIVTQSWSPLGQGTLLENPVVAKVAAKHGRTPAQVITRWHIDNGLVVIPKSVTPSRIAENFKVFDFKLDDADIATFASLEKDGKRIGPDPMTATF